MVKKRKIIREVNSTADKIWHTSYNLDYWKRRLDKIDLEDQEDQEEAFYLLLQLTDQYIQILSAQIENPKDVWKTLKNDNTGQMKDRFSKYSNESGNRFNLESYGQEEVMAALELPTEFQDQMLDIQKAALGLGCDFSPGDETESMHIEEDPRKYVEVVNFFVSFWHKFYDEDELYNDYKHGFRLPFFNSRTMNVLEDQPPGIENVDSRWEDLKDNVDHGVFFFQLEDTDESHNKLRVFEADPEKSLKLAEVVFMLLNNLLKSGQRLEVVDDFESTLEEGSAPTVYWRVLGMKDILDED